MFFLAKLFLARTLLFLTQTLFVHFQSHVTQRAGQGRLRDTQDRRQKWEGHDVWVRGRKESVEGMDGGRQKGGNPGVGGRKEIHSVGDIQKTMQKVTER